MKLIFGQIIAKTNLLKLARPSQVSKKGVNGGKNMVQQPSTPLPRSVSLIEGLLKIQKPSKPQSPWEFVVSNSKKSRGYGVNMASVNKLPGYPITGRIKPAGIQCVLIDKGNPDSTCTAAFHGFTVGHRGGKHFYVGAPRLLFGSSYTGFYRIFLKKAFNIDIGITVNPIPVWMDFDGNNQVYVWKRNLPETGSPPSAPQNPAPPMSNK